MIANITCGASLSGLVGYHETKVTKGTAARIGSTNMSLDGSQSRIITSLKSNEDLYIGKSEKLTFHSSLALAPGENLPETVLKEIADAYMVSMGYGEQPYQVYQHYDRGHQHVHIVSTRVNEDGKLISDSLINRKSQRITRELEKQFGLQIVSSQKQENENTAKISGKDIVKVEAVKAIKEALFERKVGSFAELYAVLKENKIEAKVIRGARGNREQQTPGITFFLAKEPSGQWTKGIAGAKIDFPYRELEKILKANNIATKEIATGQKEAPFAERLAASLESFAAGKEKGREAFTRELAVNGLAAEYKNIGSGPYSVTVRDLNGKESAKPGAIVEEYTWTRLREMLDIKENPQRDLLATYRGLESQPYFMESDLQQSLKPLGIQAVLARNTGGVYGISFKDIASGDIHKASEIHPSLSWNKIKDRFIDDNKPVREIISSVINALELSKGPVAEANKSQTFFITNLARNGVKLVMREGTYRLDMPALNITIPVKEITGEKGLAAYYLLAEKTLTSDSLSAIKAERFTVPTLKGQELKLYNALVTGNTQQIVMLAKGKLPVLHPAEKAALAEAVKTYNRAAGLHHATAKAEKFAIWAASQPGRRLPVEALIRALNRRGIGVEIITKDAKIQVKLVHPENGEIVLKGGQIPRVLSEELTKTVTSLTQENKAELIRELTQGDKPGFMEILTPGQERYFAACDKGQGEEIYKERENGNATHLDSVEAEYFSTASPMQFNNGMGTVDMGTAELGVGVQEFFQGMGSDENPTNNGEEDLKKSRNKADNQKPQKPLKRRRI